MATETDIAERFSGINLKPNTSDIDEHLALSTYVFGSNGLLASPRLNAQ